jgi:hypothetical protein
MVTDNLARRGSASVKNAPADILDELLEALEALLYASDSPELILKGRAAIANATHYITNMSACGTSQNRDVINVKRWE